MAGRKFSELLAHAKAAGANTTKSYAEDKAPEPGKYVAKVVYAAARKTGAGNNMLSLKFEVVSILEGAAGQEGTKIWANQTLSPDNDTNVEIFFRVAAALGLTMPWWEAWGENVDEAFEAAAKVIADRVVKISVKPDARPTAKTPVQVGFIDPAPEPQAAIEVPTQTSAPRVTPTGPKRPPAPAKRPAI